MNWKRAEKWDVLLDFARIFWGAKRNSSFVLNAELGSLGKRVSFFPGQGAARTWGLGLTRARTVELGGYRCGELHTMPV